jgi:hypothetical protein
VLGPDEAIKEVFRGAGLEPPGIVQHAVRRMSSMISLIATGLGKTFVPASAGMLLRG